MQEKFSSIEQLQDKIDQLSKNYNPEWGKVFRKTFSNTIETTIEYDENGNAFILTGDIPAMWQRDSTAQFRPYILLAKDDDKIKELLIKLSKRHFFNMNIDPYANAFNISANGKGHQSDRTDMGPWIWERKYELDSLAYPVQFAYLLYKNTGATEQFDENFVSGIHKLLQVVEIEQHHHENSPYIFERVEDRPEDSLVNDGRGGDVAYTGMSWSGFRPSDDANEYGYLVPGNMFMVVALDYIKEIFSSVLDDQVVAKKAEQLSNEIRQGIEKFGTTKNKAGETIYAYEVDGLGNYNVMDDGNVPSLLSAAYLGYTDVNNEVYRNTRKTLLSFENRYYYEGEFAKGIGSPHTPENYVWPISLAIQGLTATDKKDKERILNLLTATTAGTDMMHEGFDVDNPANFTREWFSWSNMMFCELLMDFFEMRLEN